VARRLCLVTGASAGIGAAFARTYAAHGWDLALTARRADRIESLAAELAGRFAIEAFAVPADLARPEAPAAILAEVAARGRSVDALVNNAGYGLPGPFAGSDWAAHQAFLQVLVTSVAELSHRVLPGMVERRFGRIVSVASLLGLTPAIPDHGLYSAAKAFVVKLSETLHVETRGAGVHVTVLCPGLTRSEFHDDPALKAGAARAPAWAWQDAEAVAAAGYAAVERNEAICVPGAGNRALAALARHDPEGLGLGIAARASR
jgi:short-subunit dehydrogenase